jgi:hypothetical protein
MAQEWLTELRLVHVTLTFQPPGTVIVIAPFLYPLKLKARLPLATRLRVTDLLGASTIKSSAAGDGEADAAVGEKLGFAGDAPDPEPHAINPTTVIVSAAAARKAAPALRHPFLL